MNQNIQIGQRLEMVQNPETHFAPVWCEGSKDLRDIQLMKHFLVFLNPKKIGAEQMGENLSSGVHIIIHRVERIPLEQKIVGEEKQHFLPSKNLQIAFWRTGIKIFCDSLNYRRNTKKGWVGNLT